MYVTGTAHKRYVYILVNCCESKAWFQVYTSSFSRKDWTLIWAFCASLYPADNLTLQTWTTGRRHIRKLCPKNPGLSVNVSDCHCSHMEMWKGAMTNYPHFPTLSASMTNLCHVISAQRVRVEWWKLHAWGFHKCRLQKSIVMIKLSADSPFVCMSGYRIAGRCRKNIEFGIILFAFFPGQEAATFSSTEDKALTDWQHFSDSQWGWAEYCDMFRSGPV